MKKNKPSERKFKKPYGLAEKLLRQLRIEEDPSTDTLCKELDEFIPNRDAASWWWWQQNPDLLVRRITTLREKLKPGWEGGKNKAKKTHKAILQWLNLNPYRKPNPEKKGAPLKPRRFVEFWIQNYMAALQDREGPKYNQGPTRLAISIFKFQTGIDEKLETILQFFNRAKQKYRDVQTKDSQPQQGENDIL